MLSNSKIDIVIYDLDGTLVDSAVTVTEIINKMRKYRGLIPLELAIVRPLTALGGEALIKTVLDCSDAEAPKCLNEFRQLYNDSKICPDTVFTGVVETLVSLKKLGKKLAVCTNKPRDLAIKTLNAIKITHFFDFNVCGGDVVNLKPSPDPLIKIAGAFNKDVSSCIFVGDSSVDYYAARACGMQFLFYDSGYDPVLYESLQPNKIMSHADILYYVDG